MLAKNALMVLLAVAAAGLAAAETTLPELVLGPNEAVRLALEKNFRIRVAEFATARADAGLLAEQGLFDPVLNLGYRRAEDSRSQQLDPRIPSSTTGQLFLTDTWEVFAGGLLPWGMDWQIGVETQNRRGTFNDFIPQYNSTARIQVTQPLLRGFGTDVNLAQIRIARIGRVIADEELRGRVIDVVSETLQIYNDLFFSYQALAVAKQTRDLATQLVKDNTRRAEIGVMSPLDVTSARAEASSREENVIIARRRVRDNENFLKQLVTDDIGTFVDRKIVASQIPRHSPSELGLREAIAQALQQRPDFRSAVLALQQQRIRVRFSENQGLPRLDLVGSLGLNGIDSSFGNSLDRVTRDQNTEWSAGVVVSVPIPNREGRGRTMAARLDAERALLDLQRFEQDIIVEVDNAFGEIETGRERIEATRASRILARERLDAEEEKLRAGTTTTFIVLETQRDFAEAQVAELRANIDFNKAVIEFDRRVAATLETNRVVLD